MCVCPLVIKNPQFIDIGYHGSPDGSYTEVPPRNECSHQAAYNLLLHEIESGESRLKNVSQRFITVPCGHCAECIRCRQNAISQRCYFESIGKHCFFCTLTYNDTWLPRYQDAFGRTWTYADLHDVQNLIKLLRKYLFDPRNLSFKYVCVSERGKQTHRPHFHILFYVDSACGNPYMFNVTLSNFIKTYWAENIGSTRLPVWRPRFDDIPDYWTRDGQKHGTFDCHYVRPFYGDAKDGAKDSQSVVYYVTKYMTKSDPYEYKLCKMFLAPFYKEQPREYQETFYKRNGQKVTVNYSSRAYAKLLWRKLCSHAIWSKGLGDNEYARTAVSESWKEFLHNRTKDQLVPIIRKSEGLTKTVTWSVCLYYLDKYLTDDDKLTSWYTAVKCRTMFDKSYSPDVDDPTDMQNRITSGRDRLLACSQQYVSLFDNPDMVKVEHDILINEDTGEIFPVGPCGLFFTRGGTVASPPMPGDDDREFTELAEDMCIDFINAHMEHDLFNPYSDNI